MNVDIRASVKNAPLGVALLAEFLKDDINVNIEWSNENTLLKIDDKTSFTTCATIVRYLARLSPKRNLYGVTALDKTRIDHWITFSLNSLAKSQTVADAVTHLDNYLEKSTFLVGDKISLADISVWTVLYGNSHWRLLKEQADCPQHIKKWYSFLSGREEFTAFLTKIPAEAQKNIDEGKTAPCKMSDGSKQKPARKVEGKFIELPGAEPGKVVVRFPPEASGYLHIGHAKAALLNQHYQLAFNGKLIMRFDDTNPAKETEEFERVILEDVKLLEVKYDAFSHTSDHFDLIMTYCDKMIKEGKAYCDDTEPELMKLEREKKINSKNRNNSVDANLKTWEEMKNGTSSGQKFCVRAKIDMQSVNGCMRDPTIYRCKNEPHLRTGHKYKVYPTYDFACPIVDSVEGVTHALRTTEYHDRDEQYYWFLDQLGLDRVYIWEYSRLNMTNTVLSKRKLTWFVNEGIVDGWDDPRFPTVRGVLRRGMTVEGLRQFIIAQGSSKSVVTMEWDKIWAFNKKVIDPIAPRYTAVERACFRVKIEGAESAPLQMAKHPKNAALGTKTVWTDREVYIELADADLFNEGENVTFIGWGNMLVTKVERGEDGSVSLINAKPNLENKDYKKTLKVTWLNRDLDESPLIPCICVYFEHIISKAVLDKDDDFKKYINTNNKFEVKMNAEAETRNLKKGDIIQLQRKGFFICDTPYQPLSPNTGIETPLILFHVPDGHTKELPTLGLARRKDLSEKAALQKEKSAVQSENADKCKISNEVNVRRDKSAQLKPTLNKQCDATFQEINEKIESQGNKIRQLKAEKAAGDIVKGEVQTLLALKAQFKEATGQDWKPTAVTSQSEPQQAATRKDNDNVSKVRDLNQKIESQGNKIRQLKAEKAAGDIVKGEVQTLLALKAQFKEAAGQDWKPAAVSSQSEPQQAATRKDNDAESKVRELNEKIESQGNKIRQLKAEKAAGDIVKGEVQTLLALKAQFKEATGQDWKPTAVSSQSQPQQAATRKDNDAESKVRELNEKIESQGNKIRQLKAEKAAGDIVKGEVQTLLALKAQFKEATGQDWKPTAVVQSDKTSPKERKTRENQANKQTKGSAEMGFLDEGHEDVVALKSKIDAQGDKIRQLKAAKEAGDVVTKEVEHLLKLKAQYKELTGKDLTSPASGKSSKAKKGKKPEGSKGEGNANPPKENKAKKQQAGGNAPESAPANPNLKKLTRLGLEATKEDNLSDWYSQVITKAEMIEYYDVSGCYVLRPWAYHIWEAIMNFFDAEIKKLDVQNCYFPMFVSQAALQKEKTHIADFAPEVAWVTKSGDTDLAEPIAIRPTSETAMYPSFAKWIKSHRDLPLKLNQWNSVVRWEFKHPQPFLRTREFLWQEGHTAFATQAEAEEEVYTILELYRRVYEDLLAIPVIPGKKTEKEKFAGGDFTTTVEAYVAASGRGLQGATSHHLGQNFSKMFQILFEDPETNNKLYAYQNSWGLSTRTIGAMVMVHSDNVGLVLPPRVACIQVVIVPCGITASSSEKDTKDLISKCEEIEKKLKSVGLKTKGDYRNNYSPGWKFNHWELKGVPVRLEIGPRDVLQSQFVVVRRDTGEKLVLKEANAAEDVSKIIEDIHQNLFNRAKQELDNHLVVAHEWKSFCEKLDEGCIIQSPFCGSPPCEDQIKKDSAKDEISASAGPSMGAKTLCIPFKQPGELTSSSRCINPDCKAKPKFYALFGRSY